MRTIPAAAQSLFRQFGRTLPTRLRLGLRLVEVVQVLDGHSSQSRLDLAVERRVGVRAEFLFVRIALLIIHGVAVPLVATAILSFASETGSFGRFGGEEFEQFQVVFLVIQPFRVPLHA